MIAPAVKLWRPARNKSIGLYFQSDLYSRVRQNEKQNRPSFKNRIPPIRRVLMLNMMDSR